MEKGKRERSANFTDKERDILLSVAQKYHDILESKQSDATTWKLKDITWKDIQREFNARSNRMFRTSKTLKIKYDGIKRLKRKTSAAIRSGTSCSDDGELPTTLDPRKDQVEGMILGEHGLSDEQDCQIQGPIVKLECDINDEDETEDTEPSETPGLQNEADRIQFDVSSSASIPRVMIPPNKCDVTGRRIFKIKRNPVYLTSKNRNYRLDELTDAKIRLAFLKKQLLETELRMKRQEEVERRKEWEFAEKERQWKEEEYMIKIEILRASLNTS